jgi:hypothetical protein
LKVVWDVRSETQVGRDYVGLEYAWKVPYKQPLYYILLFLVVDVNEIDKKVVLNVTPTFAASNFASITSRHLIGRSNIYIIKQTATRRQDTAD